MTRNRISIDLDHWTKPWTFPKSDLEFFGWYSNLTMANEHRDFFLYPTNTCTWEQKFYTVITVLVGNGRIINKKVKYKRIQEIFRIIIFNWGDRVCVWNSWVSLKNLMDEFRSTTHQTQKQGISSINHDTESNFHRLGPLNQTLNISEVGFGILWMIL